MRTALFHTHFSRQVAKRYQCPICTHRGTRLFRLMSHAAAKHGMYRDGLRIRKFRQACTRLSRAGLRETSKARVLRLLGNYAVSKSHFIAAKRVLSGHLVDIRRGREAYVLNQRERKKDNVVIMKTLPDHFFFKKKNILSPAATDESRTTNASAVTR